MTTNVLIVDAAYVAAILPIDPHLRLNYGCLARRPGWPRLLDAGPGRSAPSSSSLVIALQSVMFAIVLLSSQAGGHVREERHMTPTPIATDPRRRLSEAAPREAVRQFYDLITQPVASSYCSADRSSGSTAARSRAL